MKNLTATLKKLIAEHGLGIIEQEQKIKAILADLHPNEKRLRYLLELSLRAEIPKKLIVLQNESTVVWETQVRAMKLYFKEEYFLEDSAVKSVLKCWVEIFPCKSLQIQLNNKTIILPSFFRKQIILEKPQPTMTLNGNFQAYLFNQPTKITLVGKTVKIGKQVWTAENLNVTHYRNGDIIPTVTDKLEWANLTKGACCDVKNDTTNGSRYGKLYNWLAVSDKRTIAPEGWHVATVEEWNALITELGGKKVAGCRLRKNFNNDNGKGFSAMLGGRRSPQ